MYVIGHAAGTIDVLYAGEPMMDTEFFEPAFFGGGDRLLLLANFGAEDSWGLVALHVGAGEVRDYGTIDVTGPEDTVYVASALPAAEVFVREGRYVVTFRGEVVESAGAAPPKRLARRGERAVFEERNGRFAYIRTE